MITGFFWSKLKSKRDSLSELIDVFLNSFCLCKKINCIFNNFGNILFISHNKCSRQTRLCQGVGDIFVKWHACSNLIQPKILMAKTLLPPATMISLRFPRANLIQKPFWKVGNLAKRSIYFQRQSTREAKGRVNRIWAVQVGFDVFLPWLNKIR